MPRPKKVGGETRNVTIRVRFTAAEKSQLKDAAKKRGLSLSDFVRTTILNVAPLFRKATPERAAFITALAQLGKIGSNVNQIARSLNRRQDSEELRNVSAELINDALANVKDLTHQLLKEFTDGD